MSQPNYKELVEQESAAQLKPEPVKPLQGLIVAIDFDGTCVTHEYPKVGRYIGAEPVLRDMVDQGARLILWTMRSGEPLADAVKWFEDRKIPLWGVNANPEQNWTTSPKCYAKLYIDDAALGAPLCPGVMAGERPYIDWDRARGLIWPT